MNVAIDALGHRLEVLLGSVHFRSGDDHALESPEQLLAIGEHNIQQWEKIEAMGAEHYKRIQNLLANALATALQQEAIKKYGNADASSIRQVLHERFNRPEDRAFWGRLRQTVKLSLLGYNLTEEQSDAVMQGTYDKLPQLMMEAIEELIAPIHMLPRSEAHSIVMVLADMAKEVGDANIVPSN